MSVTADGSEYIRNLVRNGEYAVDSYHVALVRRIPPGYTITGSELDEPPEDEYRRVELVNQSANWTVTNDTLANSSEIAFPVALTDWGQIKYWALCDSADRGRVFLLGKFPVPLYVRATNQVVLDPGTVSWSVSGREWNF